MPNKILDANESEVRFFLILSFILLIFFAISFIMSSRVRRADESVPTKVAVESFPSVDLQAKAAYVYDSRTQTVLYGKNIDERLPLASLTKVMAALVATETAPQYSAVKVTSDAIAMDGDTGLKPGEKWSLKNLLDFSLISSSNDGIHAVALALGALASASSSDKEVINDFVGKMNQKADELGLRNTYYFNDTGLDENSTKSGAYGSAKDMAALLQFVISHHPEVMEATREPEAKIRSLDNVEHLAKNTDILASEIPGLIASKTGYTSIAGGNLVFAFDPELGRPIIISILGSTEQGRFEDAQKLISATMKYINGQ